ncbi:MAG: hypothetical protein ABSC04_06660 [Syntrophobacteraceae bacterium]|jgi:hypothetical protein
MKKSFFGVAASLCLVLCVSFAFAAEQVVPYDLDCAANPAPASPCCFLQPSFSTGFSQAGAANYQFNFLAPTGLAGVNSLNLRTPAFPGFYLAGDLPYAVNDRLKVTLGARWAPGYNSGQGEETYTIFNSPPIVFGRGWASGDSDWVTADLLASYVLARNCSCLKDFSVVAGFRYDYHHMGLSDPVFYPLVNGKASDTIGLTTQTYEPVLGFTATFPGYRCGIYGGDIKLGVLGSPVAWGNVDYRETFGAVTPYALMAVNGNLDAGQTEFFCISAEATAVSWKMCSGLQATVSIFADYTKFYGAGNLAGQVTVSGIPGPVETSAVGFAMSPDLLTAGLKIVLAF